jgi:hypothetical protein
MLLFGIPLSVFSRVLDVEYRTAFGYLEPPRRMLIYWRSQSR